MRTIKSSRRRMLRVLLTFAVLGDVGAALPITRIQDILFNADASKVEGTVTIAWREFTASDGSTLAANSINVRIVQGLLKVDLTPNENATPAGTSYQVTYLLQNGTRSFETWVVPESASVVTVSQIRAMQPPPAGLVISQSQVAGLVAALNTKAALSQGNTFTAGQAVQESSPGATDPLLSFREAGGSNSIGFRLPVLGGSTLYALPVADGLPGNQLTTDGAGSLFWSDQGSGSGPGIAYEIFQNSGASVTQRNVANFFNGLTASDNGGQTRTEVQPLYGATAGTITQGNDARLSDARTPLAHASTHANAGSDPLTPAGIGALKNVNDTITTTSPSLTPLNVAGVAGQTAPLQTWRDSTGSLMALIAPEGTTFARQMGINSEVGGTVANLIMQVDGVNKFVFSAFDATLNLGRYDDAGVFKDVALQVLREGDILLNTPVLIKNPAATTGVTRFTVQAGEGQGTTALQEWKDNAGNALTSIDAAGNFQLNNSYLALAERTAPATPGADQARLFLDAGSGEVSVKKDDGSVVSLESGEAGTGITALNTLTAATQTFATGAAGTDFAISSAGSTHTLNLPLASATSSGKLSSADWSTFDAKQPGDGDLTALAGLGTAGIIARTGSGTASTRTLAGTANEISVANADGVSGNPTISIATTFDVSGKTSTKPIKSGTTLPATCAVGEYFFKSDATAGQNTHACTATDTWVLQGGGEPDATYQLLSEKSQAEGYASLNIDGFVPNAELDPDEIFLKQQNSHTIGGGTSACIPLVFQLAASGTVTAEFCDGVLNLGTAQLQAGSIALSGSGFGGIQGLLDTRMFRLGDQFATDQPLLGHWDGLTAREILKVSCITLGGGTETVTLNLTRNGTNILSANLVADNDGQSSCNSTFDTCDVDTIVGAQAVVSPFDKIGYDFVSEANSPTDLSCAIVWQEVPIP